MKPAIILVRPQMGENIGAAARAMANFGLSELRLVAPRDGWPNEKATAMAASAAPLLEKAKLFTTTAEAVADLTYVLATTARSRQMPRAVLDAREAVKKAKNKKRVGILFGPERSGLENEDLAFANALMTIPVDPKHASLNLAQAVAVVAYEYFVAAKGKTAKPERPTATKAELGGLFAHLETELDAGNFWRIPQKKLGMWDNIRAMLQRSEFTTQEVRTWRGIIRCLSRNKVPH